MGPDRPAQVSSSPTLEEEAIKGPTTIQIKNRRLQYLRTHPEYFASKSSVLHERVHEPASGRAFTEDLPTEQCGERIGGPISANLLDAYDIDRRIAAQKDNARREEDQESVESESDDSAESDEESSARRAIVESFLAGLDKQFDYAKVDNDPSLDDMVTLTREEQERFFDDEEESPPTQASGPRLQLQGQTGILDY